MTRPKAERPLACTPSVAGVNGTEFGHLRFNGLGTAGVEDETECSSSFEDSDSGIEDPGSDSEVVSRFNSNDASDFALGFGDFLRIRRKKSTDNWKTCIQPITWRCKWLELKINNCNAQALKYASELEACKARKPFPTDNISQEEGFCAKSLPFPSDITRDRIMARKKRKTIERTEDLMSYMSNHNLFSYEGRPKRAANGARMDDDLGVQEKPNGDDEMDDNDPLWLKSWNGNVELENMLRDLNSLQSKVKNLRSRMNKIKNENAEVFSLAGEMDLLVASANELSSSVQSLASPSTSGGLFLEQSPNIKPELPSLKDNGGGVVGGSDQSTPPAKRMKVKEEDDDVMEEEAKMQAQLANSSSHETQSTDLEEPRRDNDDRRVPKTCSIAKLSSPRGRKRRGKRRGSSSWWNRRS